MTARFAPADIGADVGALPDNERQALARLVEAARIMDGLFLRQVWSGNEALLESLARRAVADRTGGEAADALHYFLINKGPWSRLDHHAPFIPGAPDKPESANFYPAGATKEEIQKWLDSLTGSAKTAATGFFTTIRRGPDGRFMSVPYSVEYQGELALAASLLREAAQLTTQPTLKTFLTSRADAFISNDYYASDVAWMELDASIEPTIGPYEVYEDEWFNFKAAFEAFITVRDEAESKKLQVFGSELQGLENALPIDPALRNPKLGALAPIKVVNVVFTAGDANRGVQTAAFNLPNDERVVKEKGTKRVMLKNVQEAKFRMVLEPIAKVALPEAQQKNVAFDAFFTHILMHELMHGLGPHNISRRRTPDDRPAGTEGNLQRDRRSEGRCLRSLGAQAARRPGKDRQGNRAHDVHDVPRLVVPLDPVRGQRGTWPRHRHPAQLLPRSGRVRRRARRPVHGRRTRR